MTKVQTTVSSEQEINKIKEILKIRNISFEIAEKYIIDEFLKSDKRAETQKIIRLNDSTSDMDIIPNELRLLSVPQALSIIREKIEFKEIEKPGDRLAILISDDNMLFWVVAMFTEQGEQWFHLTMISHGRNKWRKDRELIVGR